MRGQRDLADAGDRSDFRKRETLWSKEPMTKHGNRGERDPKPDRKAVEARKNTRLADQNRKVLGKHYANKYRTRRG